MKIILMRHGRPELDLDRLRSEKMVPITVGQIVKDYERSGLSDGSTPPSDALNISGACNRAYCSDLPRAVESISRLGLDEKVLIDELFRESSLPYLKWSKPKLTFFTWCIIFRIMWLFGFAKNGEAIADAKKRGRQCVDKLCQDATSNDTVLFLGHGIMNRLISSELKKQGWNKLAGSTEQYWSYVIWQKSLD